MLPFGGIIILIYILDRTVHLYNPRFAIVLPLIALFTPFAVFGMGAHFVHVPSEIYDVARVDGASTWNRFLLPLVLVEDPSQRTAAGALRAFQRQIIAVLLQGAVKG